MEDLTQKQKHKYEIMYIVDDQNQEKTQSIKKELCEILLANSGKLLKEEESIRKFAYEINKKIKGHYFVIEVLTAPKNIANFNRIALIKKKQLEIYRFLVINIDNEKINKFKPKRPQIETNPYSKATRTNNRIPYNRQESKERKPRPIAGAETTYRSKQHNVNATSKTTNADKKD